MTFDTEKDARDYIATEMVNITTTMLRQVLPDTPIFYEGENPIFVCSGSNTAPRMEFIITPYETDDGVYGVRVEIVNIEAAIDYIIHTNENNMISESTIEIAYHGEYIKKYELTDPVEWKRRADKFVYVEAYIRTCLQTVIDHARGWSPYATPKEYQQAMNSDDPLPTTPKRWIT